MTMKRTISKLLSIAALAFAGMSVSLLATAPAQAQSVPTCTYYYNGNDYPSVPPPATVSNYATCVPNATQARKDEIFNAIHLLPYKQANGPNLVRDHLKAANVTYFYFQNRAAANAWFTSKGYPNIFQDPSGRCGNTVGSPISGLITVVIYEQCTYANNVLETNQSLRRTTLHESGHAWALSMAKIAGNISNSVDLSTGWKALMTDGINKLTPGNWTNGNWGSANKTSYLCQSVFRNAVPSNLERDLQATAGAVCVNGNPVDTTFSKTPRQLAEQKAPYFVKNTNGVPVDPSNREIWAELFVIRHDTSNSPATFLQLTDNILGYQSYSDPGANFQCLKVVMQNFYQYGVAPSVAQLSTYSCPNPGSFVTH